MGVDGDLTRPRQTLAVLSGRGPQPVALAFLRRALHANFVIVDFLFQSVAIDPK